MTVVIDGTTGADTIADGAVSTAAKLASGVVTPVKTQVGALPSMVRLHTGNGCRATNTAIKRFTTTVLNQGTDITYADSATLGATFTINTAGVYAITFSHTSTGSSYGGLSLNSTQLTTNIQSITAADRLAASQMGGAELPTVTAWTGYLAAASVIRPHTDGSLDSSVPARENFTITRVA
mgnify:CR=1 FL=1